MKKINKNKFNSWKDYYFHYQYSLAEQFYIPLLKKINIKLKDKKIIDIGCGNGGFISAFLKHSKETQEPFFSICCQNGVLRISNFIPEISQS